MLLADHPRIHVIGAGGAGMSGLARLLAQSGHLVSGSDLVAGRPLLDLEELGVAVWEGHRPEAVSGVDLVVASSAVPDHDPELVAALEAGVEAWARPQLLDRITGSMRTLGATGTHGKTTTSALMVAALDGAGVDPSFVVGGQLVGHGTNAAYRDPDLLVLEADEAFGTFLDLRLDGLVVTNVEVDHLEHYGTADAMEDAFVRVMRDVDGPVVACVDDPGAERALARAGGIGYGMSPRAEWRIVDLETGPLDVRFELLHRDDRIPVRVGRPGVHVARNAAGALALLAEAGFDPVPAAAALADFAGVARRYHLRGRVAGVTLIDDYAHHPTEVLATLRTARLGQWRRVWAVFQPHLYSRTRALANEFGQAFADADELVVTDVYGSREAPVPGVTGRLVADAARARTDARVRYIPHMAEVPAAIVDELAPGDLVLTLGAGDITVLPDELARVLAERS
ncbi:MAG: UDP-N-acetylmuramate--L-alanine ligase [Acidimicrobiia bacterium]